MNLERETKIQGFIKIEYPNRARIFNESHRIMQTTNNFDVFQRRANMVLDFIHWSYDQQAAGMPIKMNMDKNAAICDFNRTYNRQAVRIAKYICASATTSSKASKAIHTLKNICDNLLAAENFSQSKAELYSYISVMSTQEKLK